ncbi:MAG: PEP-CTERM sorting domain-containing protein [Pseudomonadota bacterium]|nr:PEP-CTERM sorting domain-containing protein [Pseudomonadota bacterium]
MNDKRHPALVDTALAAAFATAMLFAPVPASALPICIPGPCLEITASGPKNILEGDPGPVAVQFSVTNHTGIPLILDYALATIIHGRPDDDDFINFSGVNGDQGLAGGLGNQALLLGIGATGTFNYSVYSPGDRDNEDNDFGIDPVTFSVEYSPFIGGSTNHNLLFNLWGVLLVNDTKTNPIDPVALAKLYSYFTLPPGVQPVQPAIPTLLYANGITGGPAVSTVTVFDVPEPSSLAIVGLGLAGLLARRRKHG